MCAAKLVSARALALFARDGRADRWRRAHARFSCTHARTYHAQHAHVGAIASYLTGAEEKQFAVNVREELGLLTTGLVALAQEPTGRNLFCDAAACVSRDRLC